MILHILNLEFTAVTNLQNVQLKLQYTFLPTSKTLSTVMEIVSVHVATLTVQ